MKKGLLKLTFIFLSVFITMTGCENATQLRTASISEITSAGSENYGVRVTFSNDSRLEGKGVDVQVKFNKTGVVTIWKEHYEKFDYQINESDEWYSMATIFAKEANTETYETHEKATARTYLFNYNGEGNIEITLRVVAGDIQENAYKTGQILLDSTPISSQFTLKTK